jgi:hypothetical protein
MYGLLCPPTIAGLGKTPRKNVNISLDKETYEHFIAYCRQEGLIAGRQIDKMIANYIGIKG